MGCVLCYFLSPPPPPPTATMPIPTATTALQNGYLDSLSSSNDTHDDNVGDNEEEKEDDGW